MGNGSRSTPRAAVVAGPVRCRRAYLAWRTPVRIRRADANRRADTGGDWVLVDRSASHPCWSADGSLLYYLPTVPSLEFRNLVRARRFDATSGRPFGEPFTALTLSGDDRTGRDGGYGADCDEGSTGVRARRLPW